jgi:hypothetical protein
VLLMGSVYLFAQPQRALSAWEDLASQLAGSRLDEFVDRIRAEAISVPVVPSDWHVEHLAPLEKRIQMRQVRALGLVIAIKLSEVGNLVQRDRTNSLRLERTTGLLLDLADWLAKEEGYGNLLLARRCHDIASVSIGFLMVDVGYPADRLQRMLRRLEAPWYAASVRLRILNHEAGLDLFASTNRGETAIQASLEQTWRTGEFLVLMERSPRVKSVVEGNPPGGMEELSRLITPEVRRNLRSPILKANRAFFEDDEYSSVSGPFTTTNLWARKQHKRLVNGFQPPKLGELKALCAFRIAVGHFPENRDGFENAWLAHRGGESHKLYAPAWLTYEAIMNSMFWDEDLEHVNLR